MTAIDLGNDSAGWPPGTPGVLRLASGRAVRGRALTAQPGAPPRPAFGLYLAAHEPPALGSWPWEAHWLRWPDFRLPVDPENAIRQITEAWRRAESVRVEVACRGGIGRTGTVLACLAVLDGVPSGDAVALVRARYHRRAVETPGQRQFVERFRGGR